MKTENTKKSSYGKNRLKVSYRFEQSILEAVKEDAKNNFLGNKNRTVEEILKKHYKIIDC